MAEIPAQTISEVAALDLGSNSFHLVVARIVSHDVQVLHRLKLGVRLADGLDDAGYLSEAVIQRGIEALTAMSESLQGFDPQQVRIVGTYTLRKAKNADDFVRAAQAVMPYPVEIISGVEEARLIYLGVAHTNHHEGQRLVIDIGGGSTEVAIGDGFEPLVLRTTNMGSVTFTKKYFEDGKIKPKRFSKAIKHARQEIELVSKPLLKAGWKFCLGSSGTIRSIVNLVHELGTDSRNQHVTLADLQRLARHAVELGHVKKLKHEALSEDRQPIFPAGLAILIALFESLEITELEYSSGALRDGVIWEMEDRLFHEDIRERTAQSLVMRYVVDEEQARRVETTTLALYDQVSRDWDIQHEDLRQILSWASLLHEVGLQVNSKNVHKHSEYILSNVEMPGFNQEAQTLLATLVRFQRRKIRSEEVHEFMLYPSSSVSKLIALLRLGVLLNFKRQDDILPTINLDVDGTQMTLKLEGNWLAGKPVFSANLELEQEQVQALGLNLVIQSKG